MGRGIVDEHRGDCVGLEHRLELDLNGQHLPQRVGDWDRRERRVPIGVGRVPADRGLGNGLMTF